MRFYKTAKVYRKTVVLPFLSLLFAFTAKAQTQKEIKGIVKDSLGLHLEGATLSLFRQEDSVEVSVTVSNSSGNYTFSNISKDTYYLIVTMAGQLPYRSAVFRYSGETLSMRDISLYPDRKHLQSVDVNGVKNPIDIQAGKMVYNVENSIVSSGNSAFDILRKAPGVSVGQNDNIMIRGNGNINVLIDGKMTYLTADQLTNMLRAMPAETIKRVEVINTPTSQYDAAGTAGIINIITRKTRKKGYALNLSSGFSAGNDAYTTQSIQGNISNTHFNIYGGYTYTHGTGYWYRKSYRIVDSTIYDRHTYDPTTGTNQSYKVGIDYYINHKQEIGFQYSGYNNFSKTNSTGPTTLLNLMHAVDSIVHNDNITSQPSINNSFGMNYIYRIDSSGKTISADLDYIKYKNNSYGFQGNQFFNQNGDSLEPLQQLRFQQPVIITIRSAKLDLTLPTRDIKFLGGLKYSSVTTDNNFSYDSLINNVFIPSNSLSNYFIYSESVSALYFSGSEDWRKTSLNAGLRGEFTHSLGNLVTQHVKNQNNYFDLFPYLSIERTINNDFKIGLSIARRINRPVFNDLNPSRFYRDKYVYIEGNPFLRPEIGWNSSLSFTWLNKYIASLSYNVTTDPIFSFTVTDSVTGQLRVTALNFSAKQQFDMVFSVPVKIGHFWEMQNAIDVNYLTYDLQQEQSVFTAKKWTIDVSSTHSFLIPGDLKGEIAIHYAGPSLDGIFIDKSYFTLQAGLKKSFFHKKLDASFSVSDVFKTDRVIGYSIYEPVNVQYAHHYDSRVATLTLTYHLGGTMKQAQKISVEEQKRL